MHGFERILDALIALGLMGVQRFEVAADRVAIAARHVGRNGACDALGGRDGFLARFAHLQGQLLDAAQDRAEIAGRLVRALEPIGKAHDAALEPLEGGLIASGGIRAVELFGQRRNQRGQILRHRTDSLDAGVERVGEVVDALRQQIEPACASRRRDVVDARAERLHVAGERRDAFGRRDAVRQFAQLIDRGFEITQHFRIGRAGRDAVHLARELRHALVKTAQPFGRGHRVECGVHFVQAMLDALQRRRIAVAIAALDPFGERVDVGLQAFERAAWHRLVEGARDVREVRAQRRDCVLDAARLAQRFELRRDEAELAFEIGEVDGGSRSCWLRRLKHRGVGCGVRGFIERALACRNLGDRLIDAERIGRQRRRRLRLDRRAAAGIGWRVASRRELFEPRVELGDGLGEPCAAQRGRGLLAWRGLAVCARRITKGRVRAILRPALRHVSQPRAPPGTAPGSALVHSKRRRLNSFA